MICLFCGAFGASLIRWLFVVQSTFAGDEEQQIRNAEAFFKRSKNIQQHVYVSAHPSQSLLSYCFAT
jgi:hypothetical protein